MIESGDYQWLTGLNVKTATVMEGILSQSFTQKETTNINKLYKILGETWWNFLPLGFDIKFVAASIKKPAATSMV